jgi:hypothetical protein
MEFLDQLNFCELLKKDLVPWFLVAYYVIFFKVIYDYWFYSDTALVYSISCKFLMCKVLSFYLQSKYLYSIRFDSGRLYTYLLYC